MKIFSGPDATRISLLLLLVATTGTTITLAADCGKWYSSDCIGDDDIRYDPSASNNLEDQGTSWKKVSGLYRSTLLTYNADGQPAEPGFVSATNPVFQGRPYQRFPSYGFMNVTVKGSRVYYHRYQVYPPGPESFCSQPVPDGMANVVGKNGVCGVNGYSTFADSYATSSYEKDARAILFPATTIVTTGGYFNLSAGDQGVTYQVTDNVQYSTTQGQNFFAASTFSCIDTACTQATAGWEQFIVVNGVYRLFLRDTQTYTRVDTADAWHEAIRDAYREHNVLEEDQVPVPMQGACLGFSCPTEQDWCTADPNCSVSPYQEPSATVKAGPIAGIVVAGFVVLFAVAYWWHVRRLKQQERRNQKAFARRIAETIQLQGSQRALTPQALADEFRRMEEETPDGYVSKEVLWQFLSTGRAGQINESDFNALFSAIDLDKNGKVDFIEFVTFMGECNDDFETMKNRKSVVEARKSFAGTAANRLSQRLNIDDPSAALEATKEEEEDEKE